MSKRLAELLVRIPGKPTAKLIASVRKITSVDFREVMRSPTYVIFLREIVVFDPILQVTDDRAKGANRILGIIDAIRLRHFVSAFRLLADKKSIVGLRKIVKGFPARSCKDF